MAKPQKKRKKQGVEYNRPSLVAAPAPLPDGYLERHDEYSKPGGILQSSSAFVHLPPSPIKPQRTRAKPSATPQPDPTPAPSFENSFTAGNGNDGAEAAEIESREKRVEDGVEEGEQSAPRHTTQADDPLALFTPYIDTFLDELLRLDGLGDAGAGSVVTCCGAVCKTAFTSQSKDAYRCRDCFNTGVWCLDCLLENHKLDPLHRIECWNGRYFAVTTLKAVGLRIQVGHPPGEPCLLPRQSSGNDFVIIDSDGIHEVSLNYCGCHATAPAYIQLLRSRLFPATILNPETAATFRVMETYQMLSFTAKTNAHDFFTSLKRRTNNTCPAETVRKRYNEFMRIEREWRLLKLLKRFARGHDPAGVAGTKEGECAVLCPACPLPDINMPDGWKLSPADEAWLHTLFIAIDANFKLKRKDISSNERDPGFNHGYAYIVKDILFRLFLERFATAVPAEKSTCNSHDALKSADSARGKNLAASGMGMALCSRHDMRRPTSCGDLIKGEKYHFMDYFILSTLRHNIPNMISFSYDVACQWFINFFSRCELYGDNPVCENPDLDFKFLVPKFHLPAHILQCQLNFSHNLTPRVGRTDGEAPERGWSETNHMAYSTREMGPGNRRDSIDDVMGDTNWSKASRMHAMLAEKAIEALKEREKCVESFKLFAEALRPEQVERWTAAVKAWEADRANEPNPYEPSFGKSDDKTIMEELLLEDEAELEQGNADVRHTRVSASMFISQGIDLETARRRHAFDLKSLGTHSTSIQRSRVLERGNALKRRFDAWVLLQQLYMPSVTAHRQGVEEESDSAISTSIHEVKLFLPSDVPTNVKVEQRLSRYEFKFRINQAETLLREIRSLLVSRSALIIKKKKDNAGVEVMTRSNALIHDLTEKIERFSKQYEDVFSRLKTLSKVLPQTATVALTPFQALKPTDTVGLSSMEDGAEGYKKVTWIWQMRGVGETTTEREESALRVEFCRARARAHRWQEECLLLAEEMRRVQRFWGWDAARWEARADTYRPELITISDLPDPDQHPALITRELTNRRNRSAGKAAYAHRQADIRRDLERKAAAVVDMYVEPLDAPTKGRSVFVEAEVKLSIAASRTRRH
ncbi:hypothetical protein DFP72DRAFT_1073682 [Ephemerocybe angulata]|uniref:CxC2-like cysteine cluster KDZ transposase-associated domain-containing protein n=1 Tax=Ephemerocybe angulata TaxID=980116 RepID=A0A8H6HMX3_9AGAR|nr:hypothetical protein DFP72DRAFT_1073682 [Tulosesus angulatus]